MVLGTQRRLAVLVGITIGVLLGVGGYTFVYARGYSYMLDDPQACVNCHVMSPQYESWLKGSHRAVATCNDCHTPHGLVGKYSTKAVNGWHHSVAFTTGRFDEPIRAGERNARIARDSCAKCHRDVMESIGLAAGNDSFGCVRCHGAVGHPL